MERRNASPKAVNASLRLAEAIDRAVARTGRPSVRERFPMRRKELPTAAALPAAIVPLPEPGYFPAHQDDAAPEPPSAPPVMPAHDDLVRRAEDVLAVASIIVDTESAFDPCAGIEHLSLRRLADKVRLTDIFQKLEKEDPQSALDAFLRRRDDMLAIIRDLDAGMKATPAPAPPPAQAPRPATEYLDDTLEDRVRTGVHAVMDVPTLARTRKSVEQLRLRFHGVSEHRRSIMEFEWDAAKERLYACEESLRATEAELDMAQAEERFGKPVPAALVARAREELANAECGQASMQALDKAFSEKGGEIELVSNGMAQEYNRLDAACRRFAEIQSVAKHMELPIAEDVHAHIDGVERLRREVGEASSRLFRETGTALDMPGRISLFLETLEGWRTRLKSLKALAVRSAPVARQASAGVTRKEQLKSLALIGFGYLHHARKASTASIGRVFECLESMKLVIPEERKDFEDALVSSTDLFIVRMMKFNTVWRLNERGIEAASREMAKMELSEKQRRELFFRVNKAI